MGKIDKFVNKWISKKLSVVVLGFIALLLGKLSGMEWASIVAIYVAGQSYVDRAKANVVDPDGKQFPDKKE